MDTFKRFLPVLIIAGSTLLAWPMVEAVGRVVVGLVVLLCPGL